MNNLSDFYASRVADGKKMVKHHSRKLLVLSFFRLAAFLMILVCPYFLRNYGWGTVIVSAFFFISAFLILVKHYQAVSREKTFEQLKTELNRNELLALDHVFSHFEAGEAYIDPHHMNAYDLDIFGQGSLFQYLNRTVSPKGSELLAEMLKNPLIGPEAIRDRQALIAEICGDTNWRQQFQTHGKMVAEDQAENQLFDRWGMQDFGLRSLKLVPYLLIILPLLSVSALVFWIITGHFFFLLFTSVLQFGWWWYEKKNIGLLYNQFGKRANVLYKYSVLLKQVEDFNWQSKEGKRLKSQLQHDGLPSVQTKHLVRLINSFDQRNNMLMGLALNLLFCWDILHAYLLVKWHNKNRKNYHLWIDTIAFVDATVSLANFAFNHPAYIYPEAHDRPLVLDAEDLGHPLIPENKRVCNSFLLGDKQQIVIVTGANMAGKSTFLRTVGVNLVLARCGVPVCASRMAFQPLEVFSNMRTSDSLFNEESYFFAELKRLKYILDAIDQGRQVLIILDEILKGTNSADKLYGSQMLVKRLIASGVPAIIATHDLKLTEIEKEFPDQLINKCFEITIDNNEMQFDYQLRNGVTTIMNASFLMKKMGIIS